MFADLRIFDIAREVAEEERGVAEEVSEELGAGEQVHPCPRLFANENETV